MDEEEFNKLFIDESNGQAQPSALPKAAAGKEPKKQKIILIDMKRAQNGGIALARIKLSNSEVRSKVLTMTEDGLSTEQLRSLEEFLPTAEEREKLKSFKGKKILLSSCKVCMYVMYVFIVCMLCILYKYFMFVCMYVCMHICMYVCILCMKVFYVCLYVRMYIM
jgi:hypothetical protein